jgi:hypothetical protein
MIDAIKVIDHEQDLPLVAIRLRLMLNPKLKARDRTRATWVTSRRTETRQVTSRKTETIEAGLNPSPSLIIRQRTYRGNAFGIPGWRPLR